MDKQASKRPVDDAAAIAALQSEVLAALRSGCGFTTAHKEGGTRLYFNGSVYVRSDYGDQPNTHEVYRDDAAMIRCLRNFYDWPARRDVYPLQPRELDVWNYIRGQLVRLCA